MTPYTVYCNYLLLFFSSLGDMDIQPEQTGEKDETI
jgi:hypothetical protein